MILTNQRRVFLPEPDSGDAEDLDDGQLVLLLVPLVVTVILCDVGRGHDQDAGEGLLTNQKRALIHY